MNQHDLVSALKSLALELGRTPTRREFESSVRGGGYQLQKFGGFTALVLAAGLETYEERRSGKKIDNSVFKKDIKRHLEEYSPRVSVERQPYTRIAAISDIHFPFENRRVLEAFYRFIEREQPEYVFINGDAWDMYAHSKYPRSHNIFTPREEMDLSRKKNVEFWREVALHAPKTKMIQMMGNHDIRPLKRVLEVYPSAEDWIEQMLKKEFTFDGVETVFDPRQEYMLGDIAIFHGYRGKLGDHRDYTLYNCINGHTHLGGAVFRRIRGQTLWELNSGVAGDPESKGLSYTPQKITHWTPGFGFVDEDGPRFIPA